MTFHRLFIWCKTTDLSGRTSEEFNLKYISIIISKFAYLNAPKWQLIVAKYILNDSSQEEKKNEGNGEQ